MEQIKGKLLYLSELPASIKYFSRDYAKRLSQQGIELVIRKTQYLPRELWTKDGASEFGLVVVGPMEGFRMADIAIQLHSLLPADKIVFHDYHGYTPTWRNCKPLINDVLDLEQVLGLHPELHHLAEAVKGLLGVEAYQDIANAVIQSTERVIFVYKYSRLIPDELFLAIVKESMDWNLCVRKRILDYANSDSFLKLLTDAYELLSTLGVKIGKKDRFFRGRYKDISRDTLTVSTSIHGVSVSS